MVDAPGTSVPETGSGQRPGLVTNFDRLLRILTWALYVIFIVLWFGGNIGSLKNFRLTSLTALVPLSIVIIARFVRRVRKAKPVIRPRLDKTVAAILLLLVAATVVRWPYLVSGERMVTSDDAIPALMGKHIAEGKLPPICYYGQNYLGSLSSHVFALVFRVFGYSVSGLKFATLLFYLGFLVLQFLLLKEVFSLSLAVFASLLYSLPFGQLLMVSLDDSSAYGLVLLFGSAILLTAQAVAYKKKRGMIPLLGFLMGLAFWTHPITASFTLVAVLLLVFWARLGLKQYVTLGVFALLGAWPLIFQEIFERFTIVEFLAGGDKGSFVAEKARATVQNLKALLAPGNPALASVLVLVLLAGLAAVVVRAVGAKGRPSPAMFALFVLVFGGMHWFSRFGDKLATRYLFPSYFCLPVLLLAPAVLLKSRLKHFVAAGLVAAVVLADGWPSHVSYAESVAEESRHLRQVVAALRETGEHYWLGNYWTAYSLTAISGENPVVDSFIVNRYLPYHLAVYDRNEGNNYVFLRAPDEAKDFNDLLAALGIPFERKNVGDTSLFYKIGSRVFPAVLADGPPAVVPIVAVERVRENGGYLEVVFKNLTKADFSLFRLNVEIPGYSAVSLNVPEAPQEVTAKIPAPPEKTFKVRYDLEFQSLRIPATAREFTFTCPGDGPATRTDRIVYLRGISGPVERLETTVRDCGKEVVFEISPPLSRTTRLRLVLWNPLDFADLRWYGRYEQSVRIAVGDAPPVDILLPKIRNVVEVGLGAAASAKRSVPVVLTFRYRSQFDSVPTQVLSAFLVRAEILEVAR